MKTSSQNFDKSEDSKSNSQVFYSATVPAYALEKPRFAILNPIRNWLDSIEVRDRKLAHWLCQLIPAQCPFERDVQLFGRTIAHIPPLCKLNPLYDQFVGLRFRSLCYLVDECGETV
jgi:hypothetical protein